MKWSWIRLCEAYGNAIRSYAFAARSGRLAVGALNATYLAACEKLKVHGKALAAQWPQEIAELKRRHEMFQPLLKINLTVLATAHAVSEGIIRGVAGELTRKAAPQTYGMSGRATAPAPSAAHPVSVSRTL